MGYRFAGTERLLFFGKYSEVTLAEARDKRSAARKLLNDGTDPVIPLLLTIGKNRNYAARAGRCFG